MREAYLKWLIFEKRQDNDTLWVAFQAGWKFKEKTIPKAQTSQGGGSNIMDILSTGVMNNE